MYLLRLKYQYSYKYHEYGPALAHVYVRSDYMYMYIGTADLGSLSKWMMAVSVLNTAALIS